MVPRTSPAPEPASNRRTVSVKRFANTLDIGLTKAWALIKEREVDVIHLNGRTLVVTDSIDRMIERKLAASQQAA